MAGRVLRYTVGSQYSPTDPWGRSDLTIADDGTARLEHHFSRQHRSSWQHGTGGWAGRVDAAALGRLWAAIGQAAFPAGVIGTLAPDMAPRQLTVEDGDSTRSAIIGWHEARTLPGYAEAFDILDGVIHQLTAGAVAYPTSQPLIVRDITPGAAGPDTRP